MNAEKRGLLVSLIQLKCLAIRDHYSCDDTFYSCPKSSEGCCNESKGNKCNCGADDHNKEVERIFKKMKQLIEKDSIDETYKKLIKQNEELKKQLFKIR